MNYINIETFRNFITKYQNLPEKKRITLISFDIFIYLYNNNDYYFKKYKKINKKTYDCISKIVNKFNNNYNYNYNYNISINIEDLRNFIISYFNTPEKKRITIISYDLFISKYFNINFYLDKHNNINIKTINTIINIINLLKINNINNIDNNNNNNNNNDDNNNNNNNNDNDNNNLKKKIIKKKKYINFNISDDEKDLKNYN
jgi:hypothetical protein